MARRDSLTIYLSEQEHSDAKHRAKVLGRSLSEHVRELLTQEQQRAEDVESSHQHALAAGFDEVLG